MKLKLIPHCLLAIGLAFLGVSAAHAEADLVETANIPFDFYAGNQQMPAGTYTIKLDIQNDIITLNDNSGHTAFVMGVPAGDDGDYQSELLFNHSGDSYFLREVKNDVLDMDFPATKAQAASVESAQVPLVRNHS